MKKLSEFAKAEESVRFLRGKIGAQIPDVVLTLGSGFKLFTEAMTTELVIPTAEIPNFQTPKVQGHGANLIIGKCDAKTVAVFDGRIHMYEGFTAQEVVFPMRVMGRLGVKKAILTNACGGLHQSLTPGDVLVLKDQINFTGQNCLVGYEPSFGPQFVDMIDCFHKEWREKIAKAFNLKLGVYAGLLGPTYETPAESKMFAGLNADVVGMSTVQEVIAARQMGVKVLGLSLVTNLAGGLSSNVNHEEVLATAKARSQALKEILSKAVALSDSI